MSRLIHYSIWATWLIGTAGVFAFVRSYASPWPVHDEWYYVEYATGHESFTWSFLWRQHNEHRIPWAKIWTYPLLWLGSYDYRAIIYFNVGMLSSATAIVLWAIARCYGRLRLTDAVIPLTTLSLNPENMLWAFQLAFYQFLWLCGIIWAILITRPSGPMSARRILLLGIMTLLLPGTGGPGLGLLPGLWLWLIIEVIRAAQAKSYNSALIAFGTIIISLAIVVLYFNMDYHAVPRQPNQHTIKEWMRTFFQVLGNLPGSFQLQVASQDGWSWLGLSMAGVLLISFARLWRNPVTLDRHWLPLLALSAGLLTLTAGIAYSRMGGNFGMAPRYHTLLIPLGWSLVLIWRSSRFGGTMLLLGSILAAVLGARVALEEGNFRRLVNNETKTLITSKAPVRVVAEQIERVNHIPEQAEIPARLLMLHQRGAPYLAILNTDQAPLPRGTSLPGVIRLSPKSVQATIRFQQPSRPLALRLNYALNHKAYCVAFALGKGPDRPTPIVSRWILMSEPKTPTGTATFWLGREHELQEFTFVLLSPPVELELSGLEVVP